MKSPDDSPYESLAFVPEWKTKRVLASEKPSNAASRRKGQDKASLLKALHKPDTGRADAKLKRFD